MGTKNVITKTRKLTNKEQVPGGVGGRRLAPWMNFIADRVAFFTVPNKAEISWERRVERLNRFCVSR